MNTAAALTIAIVAGTLAAGCQSSPQTPAAEPLTPAQKEFSRKVDTAHRRQALTELVRVLEIQVADADGEVGRLQAVMTQGGAFLEAYNEAYQKREDLRARLEDARMQLQALPD